MAHEKEDRVHETATHVWTVRTGTALGREARGTQSRLTRWTRDGEFLACDVFSIAGDVVAASPKPANAANVAAVHAEGMRAARELLGVPS